jgi:NAD(P)-dependent dehydrogenase (short-subunit alcohol dehydrogenase family)
MIAARSATWLETNRGEHPDRLWGVRDEPRPLAVQMWDNDPDNLARVGRRLAKDFGVSVVDLNFGSTVNTVRAVGRRLVEQGQGGSIVNIATVSALNAMPYGSAYAASKAAVLSLTRSLAVEWGARDIRVNAVAPFHIACAVVGRDDQHPGGKCATEVCADPCRPVRVRRDRDHFSRGES